MSKINIYSLMQKLDDGTYRTVNLMLKYSETEAENEFVNLVLSLRREKSDLPVNDLFLVYDGSLDLATSTLIPSQATFSSRIVLLALDVLSDNLKGDEVNDDVSECL